MAKKILVADDAPFVRMMLKDILGKAGYEIAGEASSGEAAVEQYQALKPDLVFLDTVMPGGMDGLEATKAILALDPSARIITLGEMDYTLPSAQAGAKYFIHKPFSPDTIRSRTEWVLNQ